VKPDELENRKTNERVKVPTDEKNFVDLVKKLYSSRGPGTLTDRKRTGGDPRVELAQKEGPENSKKHDVCDCWE